MTCLSCGYFSLLVIIHVGVCSAVVSVSCSLVVPAGKGLISCLSCLLCFVTFLHVSWSTSELRARLAP